MERFLSPRESGLGHPPPVADSLACIPCVPPRPHGCKTAATGRPARGFVDPQMLATVQGQRSGSGETKQERTRTRTAPKLPLAGPARAP